MKRGITLVTSSVSDNINPDLGKLLLFIINSFLCLTHITFQTQTWALLLQLENVENNFALVNFGCICHKDSSYLYSYILLILQLSNAHAFCHRLLLARNHQLRNGKTPNISRCTLYFQMGLFFVFVNSGIFSNASFFWQYNMCFIFLKFILLEP